MCQSYRSVKYKSRSPNQGSCRVIEVKHYARLVVVGFIIEVISNVVLTCVKVTAARNIGQGHRVKEPASSVH